MSRGECTNAFKFSLWHGHSGVPDRYLRLNRAEVSKYLSKYTSDYLRECDRVSVTLA